MEERLGGAAGTVRWWLCTMAAKAVSGRENQGNFPPAISMAGLSDRQFCSECVVLPKKLGSNYYQFPPLLPGRGRVDVRPEDGVGGYCLPGQGCEELGKLGNWDWI